jgi:CRISPR-associated protein Cmr6
MKTIPDAYKKVPMMFRAQVRGRSQLQYLDPDKRPRKPKAGQPQDIASWTNEWIDQTEFITPENAPDVQSPVYGAKSYTISWRFVTNGGQDDGLLRPAIGFSGIPFYPGSSMKGAFRRACQQAEAREEIPRGTCDKYCGDESEITPGSLRFLGAYPVGDWTKGLLDLVHPQQGWQVKTPNTSNKPNGESAYAQVSLYQPTLQFAISSAKPLTPEEWQQIWKIWEEAIAAGIGSKVSNGYGQIDRTSHSVIYRVRLQGRGQAPKRLDGEGEFRPNVFRAALRGHALRIFGGLATAETAERVVDELFGSIQGQEAQPGLLGVQFNVHNLEMGSFGQGNYAQPTYEVKGELCWWLTRSLSDQDRVMLTKLIVELTQFGLLLGGFGKSWRRADHRLFFEEYSEDSEEALIGCHWQLWGEQSQRLNSPVRFLQSPEKRNEAVCKFFNTLRATARDWMTRRGETIIANQWAENWREAWHPNNVQVWGRIANNRDDSMAIRWLHGPYRREIQGIQPLGSIYRTDVTGQMSQVGRIWHRMYPLLIFRRDEQNPRTPIITDSSRYLELLTIFPDDSETSNDFLSFLATNSHDFKLLWGDENL